VYRALLLDCLAKGITNFVLCPGARNAPLILTLERSEGIELYYHSDERTAAFFALGRTMCFNEPCAVITTSGTAVAECLPAVIEAHYQSRPLVIISADYPQGAQQSGAPQAIEQRGIFSEYAESGEDYTPEHSSLTKWAGKSPLHLNIPVEEQFVMEEVFALTWEGFQEFKPIKSPFDGSVLVSFLKERLFEGLILMIGGLRPQEREPVYQLALQLGVPVIADPHSGLREALDAQLLLRPEITLQSNLPGKVLRVGEVPHSRFWRDLSALEEVEVLSVTHSGYSGLTRPSTVIQGDVGRVIAGIGMQESIGDTQDHFVGEQGRRNTVDELLEAFPSSEPGMIRALSIYVAMSESLYLGNSMPIREWASFAQRDTIVPEVWANRGANGIDGQIATWLGATREVENAWCIIGDLTALYDLNSLLLSDQINLNGRRLVIINNGGGKIFEQLPRLESMTQSETHKFTQSHQINFESYAKMWEWDYLAVHDPESLDQQAEFSGPVIIEVFPDAEETEAFWKNLKR